VCVKNLYVQIVIFIGNHLSIQQDSMCQSVNVQKTKKEVVLGSFIIHIIDALFCCSNVS